MRRTTPGAIILLVYDVIRIVVLIRIFGAVGEALAGYERAAILALGIPQALFALMALFLLLDATSYRPYVPLYTAGKALSGLLLVVVSVMGAPAIIQNGAYINPAILVRAGALFTIGLFDLLSILLMSLVNRRTGAPSGTEQAEDRRRPEPVEGVH